MYPSPTEPYIPILFACLHKRECSPRVTSEAATRIKPKIGAALHYQRCVLSHRAIETSLKSCKEWPLETHALVKQNKVLLVLGTLHKNADRIPNCFC